MLETKKVYMSEEENDNYIFDLPAFGWQVTETKTEFAGELLIGYQVFARDKDMPNYNELLELEKEYEKTRNQMAIYDEIDPTIACILFFLLIIPGIIYICYKSNQKNTIEEQNKPYLKAMKDIVEKAKAINKKE